MTNLETQAMIDYLTAEIKRYFPNDEPKDVRLDADNELWIIDIAGARFICEIGSDDSWFIFETEEHYDHLDFADTLTIPLPTMEG